MNKLFLVFWIGNGEDRESCSVFYSEIVQAVNEEKALDKYLELKGKVNREDYGVVEKKLIN